MIYFDCAATSLQKPRCVAAASCRAINCLASPGRGSHFPAMHAADCVYNCREMIADFFNVDEPEKVVFTFNATHALNIAIWSLIKPGDKVVVSGYEHNAVVRPLTAIGANICVARAPLFDQDASFEAFSKNICGAKCVICSHVSNVFGFIQPIERISQLCQEHGVPLIIDASQSAGIVPINFSELGAAFIAMPGHKGLLGPQGTGVLLCGMPVQPVLFGGTGSNSLLTNMPDYLPDRLEAGTHNVAGIAGLAQGVRHLKSIPPYAVLEHEQRLRKLFVEEMNSVSEIDLFNSSDPKCQSGVISLLSRNPGCDELAEVLGRCGICVRSGLHCAPLAHESAGTTDTGTVRFSFSPFNNEREVRQAAYTLKKIIKYRIK